MHLNTTFGLFCKIDKNIIKIIIRICKITKILIIKMHKLSNLSLNKYKKNCSSYKILINFCN